jgi:hypothetical protein
MPLSKFPMTLAHLEANPRKAKKSTGPRMARGESHRFGEWVARTTAFVVCGFCDQDRSEMNR